MPTDYMDDDKSAPTEEKADANNEGLVLINKSAFPNAKPGDKRTVEIVHVYEEELAVKPAGKSEDKDEEEPETAEAETESSPEEEGYMA